MRRIIIAAAIVLTGITTVITRDNTITVLKSVRIAANADKNILATAD